MRWIRALIATCCVLAVGFGSVGCGSSDDDGDGGSAQTAAVATSASADCEEAVEVQLPARFPVAAWSIFTTGRTNGMEAKYCVASKDGAGSSPTPPAVLAALTSGRSDFAPLNAGQVAQAAMQGLDVKVVAPLYASNDDNGIYVKSDSSIRDVSDLEGKTIALGGLNNNGHAAVIEQLTAAGVDPEKVEFQLVPVADLPKVLEAGRVDAAQLMEPLITMSGDRVRPVIRDILEPFGPHAIVAYLLTSGKNAREQADKVTRFQQVVCGSLARAARDPEEMRAAIEELRMFPPDAVQSMTLPEFGADFKQESFDRTVESMQRLGFLEGDASRLDDLFLDPQACIDAARDAEAS